ncbi:MAG: prepilin-type N-terminal cleavage/methylation domain-containing protein [Phycisphaerales bacterium]
MNRAPRAFTLLELLLAIAITAILAATVYASLMVATRTRDRAAEAVGKDRALTLALDLIRRDLQSIPRRPERLPGRSSARTTTHSTRSASPPPTHTCLPTAGCPT